MNQAGAPAVRGCVGCAPDAAGGPCASGSARWAHGCAVHRQSTPLSTRRTGELLKRHVCTLGAAASIVVVTEYATLEEVFAKVNLARGA